MKLLYDLFVGFTYSVLAFWFCYEFILKRLVKFSPKLWVDRSGGMCKLKVRIDYTSHVPILMEYVSLASLWRGRGAMYVQVEECNHSPGDTSKSKLLRLEGVGNVLGEINLSDENMIQGFLYSCGNNGKMHIKLHHSNRCYIINVPEWPNLMSDIATYLNSRGNQNLHHEVVRCLVPPPENYLWHFPGACIGYICSYYYMATTYFPYKFMTIRLGFQDWVLRYCGIRSFIRQDLYFSRMLSSDRRTFVQFRDPVPPSITEDPVDRMDV
jgi:hypothetical protein